MAASRPVGVNDAVLWVLMGPLAVSGLVLRQPRLSPDMPCEEPLHQLQLAHKPPQLIRGHAVLSVGHTDVCQSACNVHRRHLTFRLSERPGSTSCVPI
jgi:hypothetical protein